MAAGKTSLGLLECAGRSRGPGPAWPQVSQITNDSWVPPDQWFKDVKQPFRSKLASGIYQRAALEFLCPPFVPSVQILSLVSSSLNRRERWHETEPSPSAISACLIFVSIYCFSAPAFEPIVSGPPRFCVFLGLDGKCGLVRPRFPILAS